MATKDTKDTKRGFGNLFIGGKFIPDMGGGDNRGGGGGGWEVCGRGRAYNSAQ